jgi:hypothetical protein
MAVFSSSIHFQIKERRVGAKSNEIHSTLLFFLFCFLKQRSNGGRGPGRDRTTRIFQSDRRKVLSVQQNHEKKKKIEEYDGTGILSHYPNRKYFDSTMMHNCCRLCSRYGEVKFQLLFIQNDKFVSKPETQKGKPFCYCWLLLVVGHSSHFLPLFYDYFSILPKRDRKRERGENLRSFIDGNTRIWKLRPSTSVHFILICPGKVNCVAVSYIYPKDFHPITHVWMNDD